MDINFSTFLTQIMDENPSVIFTMKEEDGVVFVNHSFVNSSFFNSFMGNIGRAMETHLFSNGLFNVGIGYDTLLDGDSSSLATYNVKPCYIKPCGRGADTDPVGLVAIESVIMPQRTSQITPSLNSFVYSLSWAYLCDQYSKVA